MQTRATSRGFKKAALYQRRLGLIVMASGGMIATSEGANRIRLARSIDD